MSYDIKPDTETEQNQNISMSPALPFKRVDQAFNSNVTGTATTCLVLLDSVIKRKSNDALLSTANVNTSVCVSHGSGGCHLD